MSITQSFATEVRGFSKANWWVYVVYVVLLVAITLTDSDNFLSVFLITSLHFVADIFIMMMFSAYARGEHSQGAYFQITSMLLFMSLKIYTGFVDDGWHYLSADVIYVLAAIKNYWLDVENVDIKLVNYKTMSLLSLFIIVTVLVPLEVIQSEAQWIQTAGIFLFAVALSTTGNEQLRYLLSIVGLVAMVGGSAWETAITFMGGEVVGLALSYFLLPFTVLVFYIKRWSSIMSAEVGSLVEQ